DAPAKEKPVIKSDRQANGGEAYWNKTKYKTTTHYKEQLRKVKDQNIPVHTFYLHATAAANFQTIANAIGGRCEYLNIHCL
ncbi:unnamed protein product, partial [Rotaria socialis]